MKESKCKKAKCVLDWLVGIASIASCGIAAWGVAKVETISVDFKNSIKIQQEIVKYQTQYVDTIVVHDTITLFCCDTIHDTIYKDVPNTPSAVILDSEKAEIDSAADYFDSVYGKYLWLHSNRY